VNRLPESHTDFVFSVTVDWIAFTLCLGPVGLVTFILVRMLIRAKRNASSRGDPDR
jgi:cell division protein FtsW (lipid II flippase)